MHIYSFGNLYIGLVRDQKRGGGHIAYNTNRHALIAGLFARLATPSPH